MANQRLLAWFQIGALGIVPIVLLLAILRGDTTWAWFGFGSVTLYVIAGVAFVAGLLHLRSAKRATVIGIALMAFSVGFNGVLGFYFSSSATVPDWLRFVGIASLLLVPTGYFLWFFGLLDELAQVKRGSLVTALICGLLWTISFLGPGTLPMKDTEMASLIVIDGLFVVGVAIGLGAFLAKTVSKK